MKDRNVAVLLFSARVKFRYLFRYAVMFTVGTEHATVAWQWSNDYATTGAPVNDQSSV